MMQLKNLARRGKARPGTAGHGKAGQGMDTAEKAIANAISFEIKKDGLTQRQSGDWMLRVTVQAIDMHQAIVNAAMGQRFMCVLVEIGDDETPVDRKTEERSKWRDLGPAQQAGMRCHEPLFWAYLREVVGYIHVRDEDGAAMAVRDFCGVASRSEFDKPGHSAQRVKWHDLDNAFQAWKVKEHA